MAEFGSLHQLVVVHIIFGKALDGQQTFRTGDVAKLVNADFDRANTSRVIDRLTTKGWLKVIAAPAGVSQLGRPPLYLYERTKKGYAGYNALVAKLAKYNISLE